MMELTTTMIKLDCPECGNPMDFMFRDFSRVAYDEPEKNVEVFSCPDCGKMYCRERYGDGTLSLYDGV